jgi:hypothetical protein
MKEKSFSPGFCGTISNYFSKIILIYRTRNTYGYNSVCMRIFQLFAGSRRQSGRGFKVHRVGFQY